MRYRNDKRLETFWYTVLLLSVCVLLYWTPTIFRNMDCNTARHHIEFIERCEASGKCNPTKAEFQRAEAYYRMELRSCPLTP